MHSAKKKSSKPKTNNSILNRINSVLNKYENYEVDQFYVQNIIVSIMKKVNPSIALNIFHFMKNILNKYYEGPNVISYNAAISACRRCINLEKALELLQEMKDSGICPNVITYSAVISVCEKCGNLEKALELLQEMKDSGIRPNVITYNAVISACEKCSNLEKALELLEEMKDSGIYPDVITYSAVISACEKCKNYIKALELLEEGVTNNVFVDNQLTNPSSLDFHANKIYSKTSLNYLIYSGNINSNHINGVPSSIATVILWKLNLLGKLPNIIIFGRNGDGILKDTCLKFLDDNNIAYEYIGNQGSVTVLNKK